MKTLTRNSFLGAMMATALLMSVATMAQNKVTGGRRPAGTTTQTTNSASTVSQQTKAASTTATTTATPKTRTTAVSTNNSQSKVASTATATTTQRRNDNTTTNTSGSGTVSGRRPAGSTSAATTSGSVTRSTGATHWPSSNSVTVPSTSSSSSKTSTSASSSRTNVGTSSSSTTNTSGSGNVSGGRRPTSASTNVGTITNKDNGNTKTEGEKNTIDSRLNNGGNTGNSANAGNISANSGIIRSGSGNTNIGGGRRPGVDNSNHNAASSHYELTNHRNYNTYSNNYRHNDWSRPLPPPVRQYRPAVRIITRPVMPSGFVIYNRAPRINSILGLSFGSYYNSSLNYLFTMGYDIDGYNRDVIYLRDVPMLRFTWSDVMLSYDSYGRLYNAQFAHSTSYRDRSRFNRLYHDLYATYGTPVAAHITTYEASVTWFGGSAEGYVTLEFGTDTYGRYYTMVIVGY